MRSEVNRMTNNETFSRVRSLHECRGASDVHPKRRDLAARSRVQETGRYEPAQARAKAEGQTLGLGPRERLFLNRFRLSLFYLAGKLGIGETLPDDLLYRQSEPLGIVHFLPGVVAECLFIDVTEQVKGFHADVGPVQATLQETPEVFHCVRVNVAIHVLYGVIDNRVLVEIGRASCRE